MQNKPPESKKNATQERNSKASLIFMLFGLALVFGSLFLFHSKKNQLSQSSLRPTTKTDSIAIMKKVEGLEINNQRMTAEVQKDQELLNLGRKILNPVEPQDLGNKNLELSSEPNNQFNNHDRLTEERDSYPDVFVPRELEADREAYDRAGANERLDHRLIIAELKRRAAAQNLDLKFDPATGDVTIDRLPQSETTTGGGISK